MKKTCLFLFLGCLFNSLFGEESFPAKARSPKITTQVAPYIYGDVFQPGYGVSIRTQISGHTFELAPVMIPPSNGHFGSSSKKMGLSCSYYYAFFRNTFFQPYLGCSYTYLKDLNKIIFPYRESVFSNLIGMQFCSAKKGFPGYLFIDVQGPAVIGEYGLELQSFVLPRIGAGVQF